MYSKTSSSFRVMIVVLVLPLTGYTQASDSIDREAWKIEADIHPMAPSAGQRVILEIRARNVSSRPAYFFNWKALHLTDAAPSGCTIQATYNGERLPLLLNRTVTLGEHGRIKRHAAGATVTTRVNLDNMGDFTQIGLYHLTVDLQPTWIRQFHGFIQCCVDTGQLWANRIGAAFTRTSPDTTAEKRNFARSPGACQAITGRLSGSV